GQTTSFQVRLEIMEQASAGLSDTQIASALGCSVWTVRKWRQRSLKLGHVGLASHMGRPATGPVSTFPQELKEAVLHLRTLHPGWGPTTLLAELKTDASWCNQPLPSRAQLPGFSNKRARRAAINPITISPNPHAPSLI